MSETTAAKRGGASVLGTGDINRLIWKFAVPAIISGLVNAAYNIVDQIFIGQGIGEIGMAATNVAFPLVTISAALALLFGVGGAANFNLSMGRGEPEQASRYAGGALFGMVASSLVVAAAMVFLRPLLFAFGATEAIMPYAEPYTFITNIGIPFMIFSFGASNLIRADGSPNYSMFVMLSGAVFNVVFDPIFLFVFGMGIEGIALATTLGQVLSAMVALRYMLRRFKTVPIRREHLRPNWDIIRRIAALGAASCFNQLAMTVVQIVKSNTLRHYGGFSVYGSEIPLAAVGVISKILAVYMSFVLGVAQGCQPIFSYNYGAKNYARVKETYKRALLYTSVFSVAAYLVFQLFPGQVLGIFGKQSALFFEFAVRYMRIFMLALFINNTQPLTSNFFTSIGKAQMGFWMSLTRQILLLVPLLLILPRFLGIEGAMWAGPISDVIAAALAIVFVAREMRSMTKLEGRLAGPPNN
ncbi:MATE family efflux transporter [Ruminococcaceae bacterium OttesenSCG-928-D13]|nr:MATE family efflux transporter [Ruminococcaceae bacterium OttesenSCG-928-D13]